MKLRSGIMYVVTFIRIRCAPFRPRTAPSTPLGATPTPGLTTTDHLNLFPRRES